MHVVPVRYGKRSISNGFSLVFNSQHEEKERAFKEQLSHLAALLPTLQVMSCLWHAFLSWSGDASVAFVIQTDGPS